MKDNICRYWRLAATILLIWSFAGLFALGAKSADDVKPPSAGDAETKASADQADPSGGQAASAGGRGDVADTEQPGEIGALRQRIEAAEAQIQLLKSVVIQALSAQSAAEEALRRERAARDVAPGAGPDPGSQELMLADHLDALTDSLNRLRDDVAALRAEARTDPQPAEDAIRGSPQSRARGDETEPVSAAEADPLADSGVGGEYTPLVEDEPIDAGVDTAGDQIEVGQVHFNAGSAELTPGGQRKALEAAERIKTMESAKVRVVGYADTVGDAGYNRRLSTQRARSIAAMLEEVGLPDGMVEIVGNGEDGIPVPTADQVPEPLNRCAGIFVVMDSPK